MLKIDISKEINKLENLLKYTKKIILINHRKMDTDAFGSLVGFYYFLKKIGNYDIMCLNNDKPGDFLNFLDNKIIFQNEIQDFIPDLIISFDVGGIEQLGDIYKNNIKLFLNTTFINIDHHISNPGFGNINIVDTKASSTCEIVYDIIEALSKTDLIDANISTLLLAGIIADTNNFFNTNSTPKALKIAGNLINLKARHQEIILNLFKKKSLSKIHLWGTILENLKSIKEDQIVWNTIPNSIFNQTNTNENDISGFMDEFLTTIDTLKVGFLIYELPSGDIKVSFRSKTDDIDLSEFCSKWGGGGHKKASGFVVKGKNIYEVEKEIIDELSKIF